MKHKTFFLITCKTLRVFLPALCLYGFLFNWVDGMRGPKLSLPYKTLYEKQAIWSKFLGYSPQEHTSELSGLSQDGALMIIKQEKRVLALDVKSGHTRWKKNLKNALTSCSATHPRRVFITTNDPRLFALDTQTGEVIWSYKLPHTVLAKATCDEKQVIVKTVAGEILAFNIKNGKLLWQYKHTASAMMLNTSSAPQLSGNQLIVGFPDGKLLSFDAARGELLWEHTVKQAESGSEFDQLVDIAADPVIDKKNAAIYVSAYHGMLQCLSLKTGDVKWERPLSGYMPLVLGKHLYSIDENHIVYAFNKKDGSIVWQQDTFKNYQASFYHYHVVGPLLTHQGKQLVLADQAANLYWLDSENGSMIGSASFSIVSPILGLPLTQGDTTYAMNRRSQIAAWKNPKMAPVNTEQSN